MYMIIRVIVHAEGEEEALRKGKGALNRFTGEGKPFDYYMTFDHREGNEWKCDWSHLSPVVLASSPEGKHFIEVGWKYTVEGYMEAFEHVKLAFQYLSSQEIMERRYSKDLPADIKEKINILSIRVYFDELGNRPGHPKFLYHEFEPVLSNEIWSLPLSQRKGKTSTSFRRMFTIEGRLQDVGEGFYGVALNNELSTDNRCLDTHAGQAQGRPEILRSISGRIS